MALRPFRIEIPDAELDELRRRLAATRWPDAIPGTGWEYGCDVEWLKSLCAYWRDGFDWRAQEARMNTWPHFVVEVDGHALHCVHVEGRGPAPMPLVATHGWPSSFFELLGLIGPLTDPGRHGGDPRDAFHLVVPSLPGYAFSSAPRERGVGAARVADLWVGLMRALGYERFAAHGGDWGAAVTTALGARHPARMLGLHVTMLPAPVDPAALAPEQRAWWQQVEHYRDREWGYVHLQRTKPQTAAFALTDSPAGLAAWILEKWWRWSDCADERGERDPLRVFGRDALLVTPTLYWVTRTIGPSMRMYYETFGPGSSLGPPPRLEVPLGVSLFNEAIAPPRELLEPWYPLRRYTRTARGGHFPALENPEALVREVREFFRPLR
jgi:microsomal epoxide hydrolase